MDNKVIQTYAGASISIEINDGKDGVYVKRRILRHVNPEDCSNELERLEASLQDFIKSKTKSNLEDWLVVAKVLTMKQLTRDLPLEIAEQVPFPLSTVRRNSFEGLTVLEAFEKDEGMISWFRREFDPGDEPASKLAVAAAHVISARKESVENEL